VRSKIALACDTCRRRKLVPPLLISPCLCRTFMFAYADGHGTGRDVMASARRARTAPMPSSTAYTGRQRPLQTSMQAELDSELN